MVEKDESGCDPPNCGGYFLTAFGHWGESRRTRCSDGRWRSKCYVAEIDLSALVTVGHGRYDGCDSGISGGIDEADIIGGIVGGTYQVNIFPDYPNLPILEAEAVFAIPPEKEGPSAEECRPTCDCEGEDDICLFDPDSDCVGCNCETICVSTTSFCGGFAGIRCLDGLECVDDPSDDCDPDCGGSDCGGICVSLTDLSQSRTCGRFFDTKGDNCSPSCGGEMCGGFCAKTIGSPCDDSLNGEGCGEGLRCVDPLLDGCDVLCGGGVDCPGVCVPSALFASS